MEGKVLQSGAVDIDATKERIKAGHCKLQLVPSCPFVSSNWRAGFKAKNCGTSAEAGCPQFGTCYYIARQGFASLLPFGA